MAVKPAMVATVGGVAIIGGLAYWLTSTDEGRKVLERLQQSAKSVGTAQPDFGLGFQDLLGAMPRDFTINIPEYTGGGFDMPNWKGYVDEKFTQFQAWVDDKTSWVSEQGGKAESWIDERTRKFGEFVDKGAQSAISPVFEGIESINKFSTAAGKYLWRGGILGIAYDYLPNIKEKIVETAETVGKSEITKYVGGYALGGVSGVKGVLATEAFQKLASGDKTREIVSGGMSIAPSRTSSAVKVTSSERSRISKAVSSGKVSPAIRKALRSQGVIR